VALLVRSWNVFHGNTSPPGRAERSGIVSFTLGQGAVRDRDLMHRLWERRVVISQRYTAGVANLRAKVTVEREASDPAIV